jgi:hypothetical protein
LALQQYADSLAAAFQDGLEAPERGVQQSFEGQVQQRAANSAPADSAVAEQ